MTAAAAIIGAVAFCWLGVFQLLLAGGAPLGHLAWGGGSARLKPVQRWASLAVVPLACLGLVLCLQGGGVFDWLPPGIMRILLWVLVGIFGLSLLGNIATSSRAERLHGVPLTLLCGGSCLILALSDG